MNINISNQFIEIEYCTSNRFIIFITINRWFLIFKDDSTVLALNMLGKSMKSIPLLMNGILIKCQI